MVKARPLIIAHRGASGVAPENTLAAFQLAVEQGSDSIELDVQLTKDGHVVVIHDESIERTTNGTGKVRDWTLQQLQKFDAGSWYHRRFAGERVPLLSEVFLSVPRSMVINIEIKNLPYRYEGIEEKVLEVIARYNRLDTVVISSFDYPALGKLSKMNENVKIGLLSYKTEGSYVGVAESVDFPVYSLHPDFRTIDRRAVQDIKAAGYKVFPWTVDSINNMKKMIQANVSGIITNYPDRLNELL